MNVTKFLIALALIPLFATAYFLGDAWYANQAAMAHADRACMFINGEWIGVLPNTTNQWFCPYFKTRFPEAATAPVPRAQPAKAQTDAYDTLLKNLEKNR